MARPRKTTIDYFQHDSQHGRTMSILIRLYGKDGYILWYRTLELLAQSPGQFYDCEPEDNWMHYIYYSLINDENRCIQILNHLAKLGAIDQELWEKDRVIYVDNFVNRLYDFYRRRKQEVPERPPLKVVSDGNNPINDGNNPVSDSNNGVSAGFPPLPKQIKTKETKKEIKNKESCPQFHNSESSESDIARDPYKPGESGHISEFIPEAFQQ